MENEEYIVEIVASKTGTVMRRSAPRSKEAAERIAANLAPDLSDLFAVRVVPVPFPRQTCPVCGTWMVNVISMDLTKLVDRICPECNKPKEKEKRGRKIDTYGT